jgi:hypothetical protein
MKFTNEEAWYYVLENQKLVWAKIWSYKKFSKEFREDVFQEALIDLRFRVERYGVEEYPSMVHSAVVDSVKKLKKCNASDFNKLKKSGVIAC